MNLRASFPNKASLKLLDFQILKSIIFLFFYTHTHINSCLALLKALFELFKNMWENMGKSYQPSKYLTWREKQLYLLVGENSLVCWNISHGYFLGFSRGTQLEIQWLIGFLQALCKISCCIQKDAVQFPQLSIGAYSNWGKDGISWLLLGNRRKCGIPVNPPPWLQAGHGLLHKLCWVHHHLAALAQLADLAVNLDEARKGRPVRRWYFNPWQVLNTPNE